MAVNNVWLARRHQQLSQNPVLHTEHSKCDMRYPQKVHSRNCTHHLPHATTSKVEPLVSSDPLLDRRPFRL